MVAKCLLVFNLLEELQYIFFIGESKKCQLHKFLFLSQNFTSDKARMFMTIRDLNKITKTAYNDE
jgi:hypothetical protein